MPSITRADPFADQLPAGVRQLDERQCSGVRVALLWDRVSGLLFLDVTDPADITRGFSAVVEPGEARFAFEHPFLFEPDREPVSRTLYATTEADRDEDWD